MTSELWLQGEGEKGMSNNLSTLDMAGRLAKAAEARHLILYKFQPAEVQPLCCRTLTCRDAPPRAMSRSLGWLIFAVAVSARHASISVLAN